MGCSDDHGPGYLGRPGSKGLDQERVVLRKLKMQGCIWAAGKGGILKGSMEQRTQCCARSRASQGTRARELLEAKKALLRPRLRNWVSF